MLESLVQRVRVSMRTLSVVSRRNTNMRIEGRIIGFDEYMNVVLDDAEEVCMKTKARKPLQRILLKGAAPRRTKFPARERPEHDACVSLSRRSLCV